MQCAVIAAKGKRFRDLREDASVDATHGLTIKELPFQAGYKSPRSFARAVRLCSWVPSRTILHPHARRPPDIGCLGIASIAAFRQSRFLELTTQEQRKGK